MQKIRKRSFTNYESSAQLEQSLLNQVLEEQNRETREKPNPETQKMMKFSTVGFMKSKKAKLLTKFQRYHDRTARDSTENGKISTIQSLKKQIVALESDQILSYRLQIRKENEKDDDEQKDVQNESEISAILRKFNQLKKQATTDKFRKKLLQFKSGRMHTEIQTERSSIKSERMSTRSDQLQVNRKKINLSGSKILKPKEKKQQLKSEKVKSSMSLTARRFFDRKQKGRTMTENGCKIFDRQNSIKKLKIGSKTFCRSFITF